MWKRVTQKKLVNLSQADYIIVNDLSDDYCEVVIGYKQREFAVTDLITYEEAVKYIDGLQKDLGNAVLEGKP